MDELIGRALGAYRIEERLGEGGIGAVYQARHSRTGKSYAVKVLLQDKTVSSAAQDRFQREALALSKLHHPNIVQIHDYNVDDAGMAYLVMDHLQGEDLADRLDRQGPLSWQKAYEIFVDVQKALLKAHGEGVLHRDLKPANIFLSNADGEREHALVLDFGLAKIMSDADSTKLTQTGATMGTPLYMSPEQARAGVLDERTDVYSLGCILFEMLSGSPPFSGSTLSALLLKVMTEPPPALSSRAPQVSAELDEVLRISMSKNPAERYPSVQAFRQAVERATTGWRGVAAPTQSAAGIGQDNTVASRPPDQPSHSPQQNRHAFSMASESVPEQASVSVAAAPPAKRAYLLTALVALLVGLASVGVWFAYSALQTAKQAAKENEGLAQELALKSALNSPSKLEQKVGAPPTITTLEDPQDPIKVMRAEGLVQDEKAKRARKRKRKQSTKVTAPEPIKPVALPPATAKSGGETDAEYLARMNAYSRKHYERTFAMMNGMIRSGENMKKVLKKIRTQVRGNISSKPPLCSSASLNQLNAAKPSVGKSYESMIDRLVFLRSLVCDKYDSWENPEGNALGYIRRTPTVVSEVKERLAKAKPEEQAALTAVIARVGREMQRPGKFPCFLASLKDLQAKSTELGHSSAATTLLGHHRRVCASLKVSQIPGALETVKKVVGAYTGTVDQMIASQRKSIATMQEAQRVTQRR